MINRRKENTAKKIAIGSAIAAAVGFVAGILTAPKSGRATRQDIKDTAGKGITEAEKDVQTLQTEIDKAVKQAKANKDKLGKAAQKELNDLVERAKDGKDKAGDVLGAVRAGEAEDRDLDRAVKAANRSLTHLKKYLKK